MKIHYFPKDAIAMAQNEADAMKVKEQEELNHGTEHSESNVPGGGSDEKPEEAADPGTEESGGTGGNEAPSRPTAKKKKAKKDVQG
jgi:hypothetical protein